MMRLTQLLLAVSCAATLAACTAMMRPNPDFRECANACTKRQDACMVSASTSTDVARCNNALDACVASCEKKYPRYIQPQ